MDPCQADSLRRLDMLLHQGIWFDIQCLLQFTSACEVNSVTESWTSWPCQKHKLVTCKVLGLDSDHASFELIHADFPLATPLGHFDSYLHLDLFPFGDS